MAKIALTLEDNGPNGTVKGETLGDINQDTPATALAWAAMYVLATPALLDILSSNIDAFRTRRMALEQEMTRRQTVEGSTLAVNAHTDEIVTLPVEGDNLPQAARSEHHD